MVNKSFNFEMLPGNELNRIDYTNYKKVISIITPTFNPDKTILNTIYSVLNQTYPYFELLIIDDGSNEKESLDLLAEIEKIDDRIHVIHKENEGPAKARDFGVSKSSEETEYILFLDNDDLIDKTFLEVSYFSMSANKEATWCYCDVASFGAYNALWNKEFSSEKMKTQNLLVNMALIKKSAFKSVNGFNLEGKGIYEDWILWLKFMQKGYYPIHLSYYGFWYRRKDNGGELNTADANKQKNLNMVREYSKNIENNIMPIEYPRSNYYWEKIPDKNIDFIEADYRNNGKKNILVIVPWMVLGGADKFNLDLLKLLDKNKYSITLIVTQPTEYVWRQKYEECCEGVYDLSSFLDRKDWLSFINYIIETRNIDLIFNTNSTTGYMMIPYLKNRYPGISIMDYIHMEEWYNRNGGYSRDSASVSSSIDKTLFCNKNSQKIMSEYFEIDNEKLGTVYVGVDDAKFNPAKFDKEELKKKYCLPNDKYIISYIARIDYQKRPLLLIRIIDKISKEIEGKNFLFLIVGDGPLLSKMKMEAKRYNLNSYIKFIPATNTPEEIYAISDLTINCSIKEGLALTSYESLSMDVPVISSDVGGQRELIDNSTGILVKCSQDETDYYNENFDKSEIKDFVNGIIKIYKEKELYKFKCREKILNGFTINNMVEKMTYEFDSLIRHNQIIINDKDRDKYKELLNQYFMQDEKLYSWLCSEYKRKVYFENKKTFTRRLKNYIKRKLWSE